MLENPTHWSRVLATLHRGGAFVPDPARAARHRGWALRSEVPDEFRIPWRALLRRAFLAGDERAALLDERAGIEGWTESPPLGEYAPVRVVIPVRGAHAALERCLGALEDAHELPMDKVTLVFDEAERVAIEAMLERRHWRGAIVATSAGPAPFAAAANRGVRESPPARVVVILNSDAYMVQDSLARLVEPIADGPRIVAAGPLGTNVSGHQNWRWLEDPVDGWTPALFRALREQHDAQDHGEPYAARRLVGFCLAVDRQAWDEVGGFDERFDNAFCDDDLTLRLSLLGRCVVVPRALVVHEGQASFRELPDARRTYEAALERNERRFTDKWGWLLREWNAAKDRAGWL